MLNAIVRPENGQTANKLFIGLHGWGANAADLAALADYLPLPGFKMLFPDAPFPHPYAPGGRMWYGFPSNYDFVTPHNFEAQADLQESRERLRAWVIQVSQAAGIPLDRVIIAGFSQGGAMTLDVGLRLPLAGALSLSGYLHTPPQPHPQLGPVLMVHGRFDPVVPLSCAQTARSELAAIPIELTYQEFNMGHEISPLVLQQVRQFCENLIP